MSDNKVETDQITAEQDKPDKVPNLLVLPNSDKLGEEVEALISDARGERDLLAQSLLKRTSKTEHATRMLRTIGAIVDNTDEAGQITTKWTSLPKWTNGKEATFADISRQIVPNPDKWAYTGAKGRKDKSDKMHKSGKCPVCDKSHEVGEADYSDNVDMVATALRDAARKAGYAPTQSRPTAQTATKQDESDKPDKLDVSVDADMTDMFGQVTAFLTKLVELGDSVKVDATAQTGLLDACRAYVDSCAPVVPPVVPTPATAGTRRGRNKGPGSQVV